MTTRFGLCHAYTQHGSSVVTKYHFPRFQVASCPLPFVIVYKTITVSLPRSACHLVLPLPILSASIVFAHNLHIDHATEKSPSHR